MSKRSSKPKHTRNTVRIIAGRFRGRLLHFDDHQGLRPTPDRVRETLFNWLQTKVQGARCLDLFTGSGVLAVEACSRGAKAVVALDLNRNLLNELRQQIQRLPDCVVELVNADAMQYLHHEQNTTSSGQFNIVFVDPPYQSELLIPILTRLVQSACLAPNALVYFESNHPVDENQLPKSMDVVKQKRAGQVYYYLAQYPAVTA